MNALFAFNTFLQHDAGWKVGEDDKDTSSAPVRRVHSALQNVIVVSGSPLKLIMAQREEPPVSRSLLRAMWMFPLFLE